MGMKGTTMTLPGVGELRLVTRWWAPGRVRGGMFVPSGRSTRYWVSADRLDELLATRTVEQAMQVVRRP